MLLHALPLLLVAGLSQGPPSSTDATRITVNAEARPLGELLRQFATLAGVDRLVVDPRIESRPVTIHLDDASPFDAFRRTLEAADVGYAIWGVKGREMRIYAAPTNDDVMETIRRADAGEVGDAGGLAASAEGKKEDPAVHGARMEAQNAQLRAEQTDQGYELFRAAIDAQLSGQGRVPQDPAERAAILQSDAGFRAVDQAMNLRATGAAPDPAAFTDPGALALAQLLHKHAPARTQR